MQRLAVFPDLILDARRSVWLPDQRTLVVADLHLGFAWAQRRRGQLLPVSVPDDSLARLQDLHADYHPDRTVLLGDIVHAAADLPGLKEELQSVVATLGGADRVSFILGNHDDRLASHLQRWGILVPTARELRIGSHLLLHGDDTNNELCDLKWPNLRRLIGHEHPSLSLSDGLASKVKCPCFAVSPGVVVLPAFSRWAAGTEVRRRAFLGRIAQEAAFTEAVACVGTRLLRVPI